MPFWHRRTCKMKKYYMCHTAACTRQVGRADGASGEKRAGMVHTRAARVHTTPQRPISVYMGRIP